MSEQASAAYSGIPAFLIEQLATADPKFVELQEVTDEISGTRNRLNELEFKQRETQDAIRGALGSIAMNVWNDGSLSDVKKLSICAGLDRAGLHGSVRRLYSANLDALLGTAQEETISIESSLAAVLETANSRDEPVLYCQIRGGTSYIGIDGPVRLPYSEHLFTAKTSGSGALVDRESKYIGMGSVSFGVVKPSANEMRNFVSGRYLKIKSEGRTANRLSVHSVEQLAGTEERAEIILERSLRSMQMNPVFVGETAYKYARKFLRKTQ